MKTAEEIREAVATGEGCASFANLIATEDMSVGEKILEIDRCMKIYGRQCVEHNLNRAAENAKLEIETRWPLPDRLRVDQESIRSTEIELL